MPLAGQLSRLIPAERGREGVADTNPLAVGALLVDPYFFSFGTACTHYGLTDQVFAEIYIACLRHRKPETVRGIRYVFAYLTQEQFFGFTGIQVMGETVQMATRERALLDAVARPKFSGGLGEVSRMVLRTAKNLDWDALLGLLQRWGESALVQRLGFLLDLHHIHVPRKKRLALQSMIRRGSKIHLAPRRKWGVSGCLSNPWNVIVNVPLEALLEKGDHPGRRAVFRKRGRVGDR